MMRTKKHSSLLLAIVCIVTGCSLAGGLRDHVARGNTHYEAERFDEALTAYAQAIEKDPANVEAYFKRGVIFQKKESYDAAIREYNSTVRLDPSHAKAHFNLGLIYSYEQVDYIKAIYFMERFIELAPEHPYVPEARKRIEVMKNKAYGDSDGKKEGVKSLLDLTDELSK